MLSLFKDVNKVDSGPAPETSEGVLGEELAELRLDMSDEELVRLSNKWEEQYTGYRATMEPIWKENERYWLGKQHEDVEMISKDRPPTDNRLFMSLETFLPLATRNNPEATTVADNSEPGIALAQKVQTMLNWQADRLRLKLKIKQSVRFWALYHLGCAKVFWNVETNDFDTRSIRPQRLILDKDATIEEGVYTGAFLGEYRRDTAADLIGRFPNQADLITRECQGKMGSMIQYVEWWTPDYVFWRLKNTVLGKSKNPHWNYQDTVTSTDEFGQQHQTIVPGKNHFEHRKMPYVFMSVFNLQEQPFDDTGLIKQNLGIQDTINRRWKQIDANANSVNGTWVGMSQTISKDAMARIKGKVNEKIWLDGDGNPNGLRREAGPALPNFVFENMVDARQEIDNIFGTAGSNPQGIQQEDTVRGKILSRGLDADRVAGVSEYIEQFADELFNWFVQMMYVYYDEPHVASLLGQDKAAQYVMLDRTMFDQKLLVSVKSGSMIPTDPLTKRNEAVDLYTAKALDPITLFERLDFPNPRESAKRLLMWEMIQGGTLPPQVMFPDFAAPPMMPGMVAGGPGQGPIVDPALVTGAQKGEQQMAQATAQPPQGAPPGAQPELLGQVPVA